MKNNTYLIVTLGCKVNSYESQGMAEYLASCGCKEDNDPEYIIVNTCAVTKTAERKCLTKVRSLAEHFPKAKICVVGCSSALHPELFLQIANVKVVSGNCGKIKAVEALFSHREKINLTKSSQRGERFEKEIKISNFGQECRAFIKIQDGCDNFCSYCIIPQTRGNSRSRSPRDILEETARLFAADYREIVVTGIDMGSYRAPDDPEYDLCSLISDMIRITPPGYRLRISSLEVSQMSDKLLDLFIRYPDKLASHVHIPLQSGADTIVKLMHRKYDLDEFERKVNYLRTRLPYLGLSTDVIVGFPGETEELFMETYRFIARLKFMRLHVFPYSSRPGTMAASLKNAVSGLDKKDRVHRLIDLGDKLQAEFIDICHDQIFSFLAEKVIKKDGKTFYTGYLDNYLEVTVESHEDILGKLTRIKIKDRQFYLI